MGNQTEERQEYIDLARTAENVYGKSAVFVNKPDNTGGFSVDFFDDNRRYLEFVVEPRRRLVHVYNLEDEVDAGALVRLMQGATKDTWSLKKHYEDSRNI